MDFKGYVTEVAVKGEYKQNGFTVLTNTPAGVEDSIHIWCNTDDYATEKVIGMGLKEGDLVRVEGELKIECVDDSTESIITFATNNFTICME